MPYRIRSPTQHNGVGNIMPAYENDTGCTADLDPRYTRWTNHTVCALEDRILILYGGRCKVLPLNWFYRGRDPHAR